jgi:ADP-ribosylglycohydrolase
MRMSDNRTIFEHLLETHQIRVNRGKVFDETPGAIGDLDFDRIEGMMLGMAIGDALGITTEGMLPGERTRMYGEIRDYLPNRHVNAPIGFPSDDTQLSFWTLEQMLLDDGFNPETVADRFCRGRIFGLGATVKEFIRNRKQGIPWYQCGPRSAGNGALMRIAPVIIPHLKSGTRALWVDAAFCAMITHNDSGSIATCLAFVKMLWQLLQMNRPPDSEWWLRTFVETANDCEMDIYRPRNHHLGNYEGPIWRFVEQRVSEAYKSKLSVREAGNGWYSGAYLLETVPTVIHILMLYGSDPQEAIIRAVNDTKDNDTIAAIVGAAVGALHGRKALPERWINNLSGRTSESDDGRVFELIQRAKEKWG